MKYKKQGITNQVELEKHIENILPYLVPKHKELIKSNLTMYMESKKAIIKGLDIYIARGDEKALPYLKTALDRNPSNSELKFIYHNMETRFLNFCVERGDYYYKKYMDEEALIYYRKIIDTNPARNLAKKAFSMTAKIHRENKRYKKETAVKR